MALRLRIFVAFLLCCALTGAGVGLLEAFPVAAAAVLITCNALVGLVMFLVLFRKDPLSNHQNLTFIGIQRFHGVAWEISFGV